MLRIWHLISREGKFEISVCPSGKNQFPSDAPHIVVVGLIVVVHVAIVEIHVPGGGKVNLLS